MRREATAASQASAPHSKAMPLSRMSSTLRETTSLGSFMLGIPYMSRPPGASLFSKTVTRRPRRASSHAAARPAGPEPTTATLGASSAGAGRGLADPVAQAWSLIARSLSRIVVASSERPRLQAVSQSAGHTRPVNSGKGFVSERRAAASSQRPR